MPAQQQAVIVGGNFMKTLLTIIILSLSVAVLGQNKSLYNVTNPNGDTSFWFKYQNIIIDDLALLRLDTSTLTYHFRVWKTNQVLDVWENSDSSYSARLTSWVTERTPATETPTERTFVDRKTFGKDTVKTILNYITTSEINKLPTDNLISGWKQGFDGVTYIIEFANPTTYSFKTYWTPKAQDTTLQEAKLLEAFVDKIFELVNGNGNWNYFEKSIPYECYNVGGMIRCKVLTKKQKRQYAKERKNYRQH
jgi:hypothetical protein